MGKNDNKLRVNLKMDKIWQKKEEICFCWELNSKPFMMTVVGNYLENKLKMEKSRLCVNLHWLSPVVATVRSTCTNKCMCNLAASSPMIPCLCMNASLHLVVVASIKEDEGRLYYLNKVGKDVWFPKKKVKARHGCCIDQGIRRTTFYIFK